MGRGAFHAAIAARFLARDQRGFSVSELFGNYLVSQIFTVRKAVSASVSVL